MTKKKVLLIIPLLLVLQACTDKQIAQNVNAFSSSLLAFERTEKILHKDGFISTESHQRITDVELQIADTGIELTKLLQAKSLDRASMMTLTLKAMDSVDTLITQGELGIKNQQKKDEFKALVLAMKAPLIALYSLLGGK